LACDCQQVIGGQTAAYDLIADLSAGPFKATT
jgi:hypothetical protein